MFKNLKKELHFNAVSQIQILAVFLVFVYFVFELKRGCEIWLRIDTKINNFYEGLFCSHYIITLLQKGTEVYILHLF